MSSYFSSANFRNGGTTNFCHYCLEWSRQTLENVLHLVNIGGVGVVVAFLLVSALLSLLLGFVVRCDESNLIRNFEGIATSVEINYAEIYTIWKTALKAREDNYKSKKLEWVPRTQFEENLVEPAGYSPQDHDIPLYIGRAPYQNGTVVGHYVDKDQVTYIAYDGKEVLRSDCEVLVYPKGTVSWMLKKTGEAEPAESTLVFGGIHPKTKKAGYICRTDIDRHLVIGMTNSNITLCSTQLYGVERTSEIFEVLVINAMGRMLGIDS